ncbi:symporter small accessory protein [Pseudalkalibacillus berkeleyi]|nr:symporter small accessory protein [Pseudalkalibacillus berkeleyi]
MMLGMEDGLVGLAWIGTLLAAIGCIVFGAVMWNRGGDDSQ